MRSGSVVRACRQFWDTMQLGADDVCTRETYESVHRLLTRALAPQMGEVEWAEAAADDYRDDLRGHGAMTMPLYLMSIFEVADLWTDSVEEWQYIVFINKLYRRVTKPRESKKKKLWQDADPSAVGGVRHGASGVAPPAGNAQRAPSAPLIDE